MTFATNHPMHRSIGAFTCLLLILTVQIVVGQEVIPVQPEPDLVAHLDFPENRALDLKSKEGTFELVELASGETVQISVAWPARLPDAVLGIDALDGGTINYGSTVNVTVNAEGATQVSFSTPDEPGEYRLKLRCGEHFWEMPFSVPNLASPASNPASLEPEPVDPAPVIEPTSPE